MVRTLEPKDGELRIRSGYLWTPKTIAGETRQFERASWTERWLDFYDGPSWVPSRWLDKTTEGAQMTHNTSDVDADLRPMESYALASVLGCAILCIAFCLVVCIIFALVAWL